MLSIQILEFLARQLQSSLLAQHAMVATSPSTARRFASPAFTFNPTLETVLSIVDVCRCRLLWCGVEIKTVDHWRELLIAATAERGEAARLARDIGRHRTQIYHLRYGPAIPRLAIVCLASRMCGTRDGIVIELVR